MTLNVFDCGFERKHHASQSQDSYPGVLLPREHEQFGPREFVDGVSQLRRVVLDRKKSSIPKDMSHELGAVKRREFRLELAESRRIVPEWTGRRPGRGARRTTLKKKGAIGAFLCI
jgi:hypothetical protein